MASIANLVPIQVPCCAYFVNCTIDGGQLNSAKPIITSSFIYPVTAPTASFVNCIISSIPATSSGLVTVSGNNNGFYNSPQFGGAALSDDQPPFAPTGYTDPVTGPMIYIANGQGAYYLRLGSPFVDAGTSVDSDLQNALSKRTTSPPELFFDDVNSSRTMSPTLIRDSNVLDLGYHYPVVHYVLDGAT